MTPARLYPLRLYRTRRLSWDLYSFTVKDISVTASTPGPQPTRVGSGGKVSHPAQRRGVHSKEAGRVPPRAHRAFRVHEQQVLGLAIVHSCEDEGAWVGGAFPDQEVPIVLQQPFGLLPAHLPLVPRLPFQLLQHLGVWGSGGDGADALHGGRFAQHRPQGLVPESIFKRFCQQQSPETSEPPRRANIKTHKVIDGNAKTTSIRNKPTKNDR